MELDHLLPDDPFSAGKNGKEFRGFDPLNFNYFQSSQKFAVLRAFTRISNLYGSRSYMILHTKTNVNEALCPILWMRIKT